MSDESTPPHAARRDVSWARCAEFCDLPGPGTGPASDVHGPYCVSRPVAREIIAATGVTECDVTIDLAAGRGTSGVEAPRFVRLVVEYSGPDGGPSILLEASRARSLAAALVAGADQCEQLDRDLARRGRR
ncbi:MAG: hypothetical protein ACRDWT_11440 [Jatrophihabitantaceae bacterium]